MPSRTEVVLALVVVIFGLGPAVLILIANSLMKKDERGRKPR